MKRVRSILKNSLYNTGGMGTLVVLQLVVIPYYVYQMGEAAFGVYALINSMVNYANVLDLGLGQGVTKYTAECKEKDDFSAMGQYVGVAVQIVVVVGGTAAAAGYLWRGEIAGLLIDTPNLRGIAIFGVAIASASIPFALLMMVGSAALKGLERYGIVNAVTISINVLSKVAGVFFLYFGYGVKNVLIADVLAVCLGSFSFFVTFVISTGVFPFYFVCPKSIYSDLLKFGGNLSIMRIAVRSTSYLPRFFLSSIAGPKSVTYYELAWKIVNALQGTHNQATNVLIPVASRLSEVSSDSEFTNHYLSASKFAAFLAVPIFTLLIFFGESVLTLWVGESLAEKSTTTLWVLGVAALISSFTNIPSYFAMGEAKTRVLSMFGVVLIGTTVGGLYFLVPKYGVVGAAIGVLIGRACSASLLVGLYNRMISVSKLQFILKVILQPIGLILPILILSYGFFLWGGGSALLGVICAVLAAVAYAGLFFLLGFLPRHLFELST
jgi:O-antigen/teichoic acid export membrane protein